MIAEPVMMVIATIMLGLNMFGVGNPGVIFWVWISCFMWYCAAVEGKR